MPLVASLAPLVAAAVHIVPRAKAAPDRELATRVNTQRTWIVNSHRNGWFFRIAKPRFLGMAT